MIKTPSKLDDYARYFKVVGNPHRLSIVLILYASEVLGKRHSLSFTQIIEVLGIPKERSGTLNSYLKQLIEADFIDKDNGEKRNPIYHLGKTGREFLEEFGLTEILDANIMEYADKTS